jgi:hypothetical protein
MPSENAAEFSAKIGSKSAPKFRFFDVMSNKMRSWSELRVPDRLGTVGTGYGVSVKMH